MEDKKIKLSAHLEVCPVLRTRGRIIVPSGRGVEPSPWIYSKRQGKELVKEGFEKNFLSIEETFLLLDAIERSSVPRRHWSDGFRHLPHWRPEALTLWDLYRCYEELVEESLEEDTEDFSLPDHTKVH